jgi:IS30 family transposase
VGHWKIYTVMGKGQRGALVNIVSCLTQYTVSKPVNRQCAAKETAATIALLIPFKQLVHTTTADNGKDFVRPEDI